MAILAWISIVLSLSAAGFCAFLYYEVQKRVPSTAVTQLLKQSSEELSKDYGRQFRSIETEWDDMYQKFGRLVGRMDRGRYDSKLVGNSKKELPESDERGLTDSSEHRGRFTTRADILRSRRSTSNEQGRTS